MDLSAILSDKPAPVRTETEKPLESAMDVKPAVDEPSPLEAAVREEQEPAAPSAAQEPEKPEAKAEPEAEKPEVEADAEEAEKARERDEKGRFVKTVPHEAFHAERMKRQEAERKLAAQVAAKPPTSVLENEDQAFSERISAALKPWQERFFKLSVKTARNTPNRSDYEAVAESFTAAADSDPRLWSAFQESDDPGEYIYAVGKQLKELAEFGGDIVQYGEKKRSEGAGDTAALKDEIKALKAKVKAFEESKERQQKIPQSLNGEQSSPVGSATAFSPPTLRDIINVKS